MPYKIPSDWLEDGWQFAIDDSVATYRLLNEPYKEGITQTGVIDGFLTSPNIEIGKCEVLDFGFELSDHNPVKVTFTLND